MTRTEASARGWPEDMQIDSHLGRIFRRAAGKR
jgi:hypothetical protein